MRTEIQTEMGLVLPGCRVLHVSSKQANGKYMFHYFNIQM